MKQEGHLQVFELMLQVRGPVFIGNGKSYTKKEYIFDPKSAMVSFLDERAMFDYLAEHDLADAYEGYILGNAGRHLRDFLGNICKIPQKVIDSWTRCRVYAGDALDDNRSLKEIQQFVRDGEGRVYVPGSSIKGALRTVLLKAMILQKGSAGGNPVLSDRDKSSFEHLYFHKLSLQKDRNGIPVVSAMGNSLMRGLMISDSLPLADSDLCLTRKIDSFPDDSCNQINICRECLKPGTVIRCTLTLDHSILRGGITKESIEAAIRLVSDHYQKTVLSHYPHAPRNMNGATILLGGGVGFRSKTVTDVVYGNRAVSETAAVLQRAFPKHHHDRDVARGLSPRALKETDFNGAAYLFGVCEVILR